MFYLSLSLVAVAALCLGFSWWRNHRLTQNCRELEPTVLQVLVPKDNERGPKVAEQIYDALYGIGTNYGWKEWLLGEPKPRLSFEIASIDRQIRFFLWTPKRYLHYVQAQLYAQYPKAETKIVEDYTSLAFYSDSPLKPEHAVTAELKLLNPPIYPIKRYAHFEDRIDNTLHGPLAAVLSPLSSVCEEGEQAWIQVSLEPLGDFWRLQAIKCLRLVNRGLFESWPKLKDWATRLYLLRGWARVWSFPLYLLLALVWLPFFLMDFLFYIRHRTFRYQEEKLDEETSRSHEREDPISAAMGKANRLCFDVNLRLVFLPLPEYEPVAAEKLRTITGAFHEFTMPNINGLGVRISNQYNLRLLQRYRKRQIVSPPLVLSSEELATIYHLPVEGSGTSNMLQTDSRRLEPPHNLPTLTPMTAPKLKRELTIIGESHFRGHCKRFGIKRIDRRRHFYLLGKTGMGKSVLLQNMVYSDIKQGRGVAVIDPHGDLAETVLKFMPRYRTNDVVVLDPSDTAYPFAFNMLEGGGEGNHERYSLVASGLIGVFKKMYSHSWGPRLEHILRNSLLALAEVPNTSILGVMRILSNEEYRQKIVSRLTNPMVRSFWEEEFARMNERLRTEAISPIQNKVGQFLSSPMVRNLLGQVKSSVNLRHCMDTGKVVLVNLSKGKIGEDNSNLLGSMLITKFQLDAMSRADTPEAKRRDFYLYVDEFQNFATDSFATILSEARKYRLNLTMANQYVAQMPDQVKEAVFGNVGSILSFQVGYEDAAFLANQFSGEVTPNDIVSLPKYNCYCKLMIDGMPSKTFSLTTLPPPKVEVVKKRSQIIVRLSRERYGTPSRLVESRIRKWISPSLEG